MEELKERLESLNATRGLEYLQHDPLRTPHRYSRNCDREIIALLSALFAYGKVEIILRNLDDLCKRLGEQPYDRIVSLGETEAQNICRGFVHRLHDGEVTARLLLTLKEALNRYGSLKNIFLADYQESAPDIGTALNGFSSTMKMLAPAKESGSSKFDPFGHFFPSPKGGSACKRLCLFLRWVCRSDDGIDLGLWPEVSPAKLILPLDTHTGRIGRLLRLTGRRTPDWKMAVEITDSLKRFDPNDPVKYDFALAHIGISDGCTGKHSERCADCLVQELCTEGKKSF